jgi:hypothetical protein
VELTGSSFIRPSIWAHASYANIVGCFMADSQFIFGIMLPGTGGYRSIYRDIDYGRLDCIRKTQSTVAQTHHEHHYPQMQRPCD